MVVAFVALTAFLYARWGEERRKFIKSVFDLSWNIWSLASVAVTAYKLMIMAPNLSEFLNSFNPVFVMFMVFWAVTTAGGRVAIALMDSVSLWRKKKPVAGRGTDD